MKWFKKNKILLGFFLIFALFSYLEIKKEEDLNLKKVESEKIFVNFHRRDITLVKFYIEAKLKFQLIKEDKNWFVLSKGVKDNANPVSVNIFLNKITGVKKQKVSHAQGLSSYGLSSPKSHIVFQGSENKKYKLYFGDQSFDKQRFILTGKEKNIFLANSPMNFATNKSFNLFRLKKLFPLGQAFDEILIHGKKNKIHLYKKNNLWSAALPKVKNYSVVLDKSKADKLISAFKHLELQEFIRENKSNSKKLLKQYRLLYPELSISIFNKSKKVWVLSLSQNTKGNFIYAKTSKRSTVYSISKDDYRALSAPFRELRDLSYMFGFKLKNIDQIFFQVGKRKRQAWFLKNKQWFSPLKKKLNTTKVQDFLSQIIKFKTVKFILNKNFKQTGILESLSLQSNKKTILTIKVLGYVSSQDKANLNDLVVLSLGNPYEHFAVSKLNWISLKKNFLLLSLQKK